VTLGSMLPHRVRGLFVTRRTAVNERAVSMRLAWRCSDAILRPALQVAAAS
jgi:hypothetical protein